MSDPLIEQMAKEFVAEVRDGILRRQETHFLGDWAAVRNNDIYKGLVERLDHRQKDLLWELLAETVDATVHATLHFVDNRRVNDELRVVALDPDGGAERVLTADEDLAMLYQLEWVRRYARDTSWPKTRRLP